MRIGLASVFLLFSVLALAAPKSELWPVWQASREANVAKIDHALWHDLLQRYVNDHHPSGINRFDYARVHSQDLRQLDTYLRTLTSLDPRTYAKAEQKAYWINLYNALTVQLMLQQWPVSSITKLGPWYAFGPWDETVAEVAGHALTLNDIEHRILRPIWQDARIHYAVNCASLGCPNLQASAFTAGNSEALLEQAASDFINHPRGVRWQDGRWQLSSIYDWYGVDFPHLAEHLKRYAKPALRQQFDQQPLANPSFAYDWAVNAP